MENVRELLLFVKIYHTEMWVHYSCFMMNELRWDRITERLRCLSKVVWYIAQLQYGVRSNTVYHDGTASQLSVRKQEV